jgi:hypothetical protein
MARERERERERTQALGSLSSLPLEVTASMQWEKGAVEARHLVFQNQMEISFTKTIFINL